MDKLITVTTTNGVDRCDACAHLETTTIAHTIDNDDAHFICCNRCGYIEIKTDRFTKVT